jgi:dihydroneopterin aldolase
MENDIIIRIARLALTGRHGCAPSEKKTDAPFEIDIELRYPEPPAPLKDDFVARPDYAAVALRAAALFRRRRYRLIEPLATMIAERLLAEFPLSVVSVTIRKLKPAIDLQLGHAEVAVTRRQEAKPCRQRQGGRSLAARERQVSAPRSRRHPVASTRRRR